VSEQEGDEERKLSGIEIGMLALAKNNWEILVGRLLRTSGAAACIECGRCTASCPAALPSHLRARNVIRAIQDGDRSIAEDMDDIWHCTTCFDCQDRCPKGVQITQIILYLRAFGSGLARWPEPHDLAFKEIASTGNTFPLDDEVRKVRGRLGLPLDPADCAHDEEELAAFQRLLEILDFNKIATRRLRYYPPGGRVVGDWGDD
jgi:heterodisulfide reductase subunit C